MTESEIIALRHKINDQKYIRGAVEAIAADLQAGRIILGDNPTLVNSRRCTICMEVKPASEFYRRSDGNPMSWCKKCISVKVKTKKTKRQLNKEPQNA